MRVLVIGGTTFIGPVLVRRLAERGNEVAVFHRERSETRLPPGVEQILGDRHKLEEHGDELRRFRPDVVVDMIAFTEADAIGIVKTFRGKARRVVVISSADVYRAYGRFLGIEPGPIERTPIAEDAPLRSVLFPYRSPAQRTDDFSFGYDKIPVERIVLGDSALPGTVLRLPMVHGPGDPYRRFSPYVKRMKDGRPFIVLSESHARWRCPRGHVENVAAAIVLAVVDHRAAGRIYNIAEPVAFTEADWIRRIGELVGWRGSVLPITDGRISVSFDLRQSLDSDSGRIRRELGYSETISLGDGLRSTIEWEQAQPRADAPGIGLLDYAEEDAILAGS
jgi:nucleoside-diphosphate-sugar epimerase